MKIQDYKYIVIGAGFAGSVLAERIANEKKENVLVIEKKNYIGGHCYDYEDKYGIMIHRYGPHIFHTNDGEVWRYLSQFTDWHYYHHRVLGFIDGYKVPIPFNLKSLHLLFPNSLADIIEKKLIERFGFGSKVHIFDLKKTRDNDLQCVSDFVYNKVFLNYTTKQWGGLKPEELDKTVTERVPFIISNDDRYFYDKYQGIPSRGYTSIFKRLLNNKKIKVLLGTHSNKIIRIEAGYIIAGGKKYEGSLIFTGKIDELFSSKRGELPYRSLNFKINSVHQEYFQESAIVNYPNNYDFTRIAEYKHFIPFRGEKAITTIVIEYPANYDKTINDPYYIVPTKDNLNIYTQYLNEVKKIKNLYLVGRLAEYRYYNMDEIVRRALDLFSDLK